MKHTPVEQFGSFFVKREDMYGEYPYPPLSKLRGEKMKGDKQTAKEILDKFKLIGSNKTKLILTLSKVDFIKLRKKYFGVKK